MHLALIVSSLIGAAAVLAWRVRETRRPITARKIVLPPLGMSTGFGMFAYAPARIPLPWAVSAFLAGALLLAYPVMKTSKLVRQGDVVLMQRSKAFLWILFGLVVLRVSLRAYVEQYVNPLQTGALFFVLAFGMILRWRATMYLEYRKLTAQDG
jgi:membrane protein CcdC involved in cytochrome C biogenesis